jgi:hypothetical protein
MANILHNVDVDIDVDAEEWFDTAYDNERREMYEICKKHFEGDVGKQSALEEEFNNKLKELSTRYISLTKEQFNLIMSI